MARSSWKYYFYTDSEVLWYTQWLIEDLDEVSIKQTERSKTIHKLNYLIPTSIYTGKWTIEKRLTKFHFGLKLGQFTKTRKPYYFRSKKKR